MRCEDPGCWMRVLITVWGLRGMNGISVRGWCGCSDAVMREEEGGKYQLMWCG